MKNYQLSHFYISALILFTLSACGGGGASDTAKESVSNATTATTEPSLAPTGSPSPEPISPEPTMEPELTEQTTKALIAPADFNFSPDRQVTLQVALDELIDQRAYFSLYQDYYQHQDGSFSPNYASRVVASALSQGKLDISLSLGKAHTSYLAEIWFYDGRDPLQQIISVEQNRLTWQ